MLSKLSCRVLTGVITIPVMLGLAGCNGQDAKKSEPVKPAVSSSQVADNSSKDSASKTGDAGNTSNTSNAGDASKTGNASNAGKAVDGGKSSNSSGSQSVKGKSASSGKGSVKSVTNHKPVKQQTSKSGKTGKSNPGSSKPKTNTGKTSTGKTNNGYKLQPGEVIIDKNNMDKDGSITLGGDSEGNVW